MHTPPCHTDTSIYKKQEAQLKATMKDRPNAMPFRSGGKKKNARMAPYEASTIHSRTSTLAQFVGFCHKCLGLDASMANVTDAMAVAKFWGWHISKGTLVSGRVGWEWAWLV